MIFVKLTIFLILLLWSGGVLTNALVRISRNLKLSSFTVSFLIMAAATTVPELFVSIMSAFDNQSSLAFGVVIGSNIANIALVLGLLLIFAGHLKISGEISKKESLWVSAIAVLPLLFALDGVLSRIDGVILLAVFIIYLRHIISASHFFQKVNQIKESGEFWFEVGKFITAVIILLISARYLVLYSERIAQSYNFPLFLIGILVIALGTSLPELVFAYKATKADQPKLSFGDITGAIVFNSSVILGITILISPFQIANLTDYYLSFIMLAVLLIYFAVGSFNNRYFSRNFGLILIALYLIFLFIELI